ncbi:hypothetical protein QZH41_008353 [Actinostola sp. cb2023]|nr:hypothetical protein QZH41_008353 [Actinostola sp. cb2023]
MAMQTCVVYGRLFCTQARQAVSHILGQEAGPARVRLIAVCCGFSKDLNCPARKFVFGDDAYFVADNRGSSVMGVADGVGGWHQYGIDSSKFASSLMEGCRKFAMDGGLNVDVQSPIAILKSAFQEMTELKASVFGSSTACIIVLDKNSKTLRSMNLGDSGFLIIRKGLIVHQSSDQQHYFNTPYQLAIPPPGHDGRVIQDSLDVAELTSFQVEVDDLIVMGTDGLFDNFPNDLILQEISLLENFEKESIQSLADNLAMKAKCLAFDPSYDSPFAKQAKFQGLQISGGKPDDITVLISVVTSDQSPTSE